MNDFGDLCDEECHNNKVTLKYEGENVHWFNRDWNILP
jgi:hypothetical protein